MAYILENESLQFTLNPAHAIWSLYSSTDKAPRVECVRSLASYRIRRKPFTALSRWDGVQVSDLEMVGSRHGLKHQITATLPPDPNGLRFELAFALPDQQPFLMWKLGIQNEGQEPAYIDRLTVLQVDPRSSLDSKIHFPQEKPLNLAFFSNGWGSWNYSGVYASGDRFQRTRLGFLSSPMRVNAGTPQPWGGEHFASDMFGVLGDRLSRTAILAGFLSQCQHFGSLETWLRSSDPVLSMWANGDGARLDPGTSISTDWAFLQFIDLDAPDPLDSYLEAVARQSATVEQVWSTGNRSATVQNQASTSELKSKIPLGWCSWYQFFSQVTADDIRRNLVAAQNLRHELPLDVIQIDDGFQTRVGDWFDFSPSFPQGVAPLAADIHTAGFVPGLWLAPFIVHPRSRLYAEHPDWLLRGKFNRPVNAGFLFDGAFTTALDLTIPQALDYTRRVIHTAVHEWGFPYLKLDFLYAAALPGRYRDPTRSRAQVLRDGLLAIRAAAGEDAYLLACGCPFGPAVGLVDAMRIGADVDVRWQPAYKGIKPIFNAEPDFPSARNAIQNTITRAHLHSRLWANDPDCLLLRPETHLTLVEVQSLATVIALSGGLLLLSDDLSALPPERLRIAQSLIPLIGERPQVCDWFDKATPHHLRLDLENESGPWHLLALFNWEEAPRKMDLRLADVDLEFSSNDILREFWSGKVFHPMHGSLRLSLPAHGVALLALRQWTPSQPQFLGSDLHISQGLEIVKWVWEPVRSELIFHLARPGRIEGMIDLYLPGTPRKVWLNGESIGWNELGANCYRFQIAFDRLAELKMILNDV